MQSFSFFKTSPGTFYRVLNILVYRWTTELHRNWKKKVNCKESCFPKVQVRCDSFLFFSATRVSFRMIPSLEMSLTMLWTETWAVLCVGQTVDCWRSRFCTRSQTLYFFYSWQSWWFWLCRRSCWVSLNVGSKEFLAGRFLHLFFSILKGN